jgi:hypothetical protein
LLVISTGINSGIIKAMNDITNSGNKNERKEEVSVEYFCLISLKISDPVIVNNMKVENIIPKGNISSILS